MFKLGDKVKIIGSSLTGLLWEDRGNLGPNGARIWRVLLDESDEVFIEVREDQLIRR